MSHCGPMYGLDVVVVVVGRISRCMVFVAILVAVRNFEMFKIPHCDFSIAVYSVCCLSALAQLVLWSQYDLPALSMVALLDLGSHECTATVLRLYGLYCDQARSRATRNRTACVERARKERTETMGDGTAHAQQL